MVISETDVNLKVILTETQTIDEHAKKIALESIKLKGKLKSAFDIAIADFSQRKSNKKNGSSENGLICFENQKGDDEQIMKFKGVSVQKKPGTNIYWARYTKNKKVNIVYGKTKLECYNNLKNIILNQVTSGTVTEVKTKSFYTLKSWYEYFMKTYKLDSGKIRESTIKDDNYIFNCFEKYHDKNLNYFKESIIKEMINLCSGDRKKQKAYVLLHSLFKKAKVNNFIKIDPTQDLEKPSYKAPEKKIFTTEEQKIFLEACKKQNSVNADFLSICLLQGFTRGECWGLTNNKLDFEKSLIIIDECIKQGSNDTKTKNKYRNRVVPMFEQTKSIFLKYSNKKGRLFDIKTTAVYDDLKKICQSNNLPLLNIHELRHTFITRCQELNIPLYVIQAWVGHAKGSQVTTSTYTHITSDISNKFIAILNNKKSDLGTR